MGRLNLRSVNIFYSKRSFTIVEVLVALFLFLITVAALTANSIYVTKYQKINEEREKAIVKAQVVLNRLMSLAYNNTCLNIGSFSCANDNGSCCGTYQGDNSITWTVSDGPDSNITKQIVVQVSFSYQDYSGSVKLTSIKGDW